MIKCVYNLKLHMRSFPDITLSFDRSQNLIKCLCTIIFYLSVEIEVFIRHLILLFSVKRTQHAYYNYIHSRGNWGFPSNKKSCFSIKSIKNYTGPGAHV